MTRGCLMRRTALYVMPRTMFYADDMCAAPTVFFSRVNCRLHDWI